ncbi:MAG: hypothetical protein ACKOZU_04825 [Planctomycetaceae bacterium]
MSLPPEPGRVAPVVELQHDRPGRRYDPGDSLGVRYRVGGVDPESVRALELSVAWYTEGKGEEDLFVHAFERITERGPLRAALAGGTFNTRLPPSPLSYEGIIVKIRWCVRVRVFFAGGRDYVSEHVFDVGGVPPARAPAEETTS